jgi:hypothetical protein
MRLPSSSSCAEGFSTTMRRRKPRAETAFGEAVGARARRCLWVHALRAQPGQQETVPRVEKVVHLSRRCRVVRKLISVFLSFAAFAVAANAADTKRAFHWISRCLAGYPCRLFAVSGADAAAKALAGAASFPSDILDNPRFDATVTLLSAVGDFL